MFDFNVNQHNDVIIFEIKGTFTFEKKDLIYREFDKYLKQNIKKFIFNLEKTEYMDSSGVGTILMGASYVNRYGEKIKIVGQTQVIENFKCLKVDKYVDFCDSVDSALTAFGCPI